MRNSLCYQIRDLIFDNNLNFIIVTKNNSESLRFTKDDISIKYNPITKESILELSSYKLPYKFRLSDTTITDIYFSNGLSLFITFDTGKLTVTRTQMP